MNYRLMTSLAALLLLTACTNEEKERCQARYEQIMADGYSTVPEQHERMTGELMSFLNSSCKKYLQ